MNRWPLAILLALLVSCSGKPDASVQDTMENNGIIPEGEGSGASRPGSGYETATFGGGCFWCTEAVYSELKGVMSVTSGYSGGTVENPTYKQVCSGTTGHAECIQIRFDPEQVSFAQLLEVFFKTHDPTTLNRQGADVGTQYRSVVFYHTEQQKEIVSQVIANFNDQKVFPSTVVTQVVPFEKFYPAEDYHQEYYQNNYKEGYCVYVIQPKLEKFRAAFGPLLKNPEP